MTAAGSNVAAFMAMEEKRNISQLSKQMDHTFTKWDRLYVAGTRLSRVDTHTHTHTQPDVWQPPQPLHAPVSCTHTGKAASRAERFPDKTTQSPVLYGASWGGRRESVSLRGVLCVTFGTFGT